ncbi:MAG: SCO1664 family protein [Actinomycetes bacterium]|jgi:uncharacterized repeat protein (TIGR03843 family)
MKTAIDLISNGNLLVIGRLVDASNATLLAHVEDSDPKFQVIYKPIAGERPLWDFPDGDLASREYAAYLLSDLAGFDLVPLTLLREGPFGFGMVQQWIDIDESVDVVEFGQSDNEQLRKLALFDAIINNTDRKFGHLLIDSTGVLKGCDHGVCFHAEDKLRTVIWQFAGQPFNKKEIDLLKNVADIDLTKIFAKYLTEDEVQALRGRVEILQAEAIFPLPSTAWPAVPWPPV